MNTTTYDLSNTTSHDASLALPDEALVLADGTTIALYAESYPVIYDSRESFVDAHALTGRWLRAEQQCDARFIENLVDEIAEGECYRADGTATGEEDAERVALATR